MHMLDLPICDFFEYVPGSTWQEEIFVVVTVVRSDVWWNTVFPQMQRFWGEVEYFRREVAHNNEEVIKQLSDEPVVKRRPRKAQEIDIDVTLHCNGPMSLDQMLKEESEGVFKGWNGMAVIGDAIAEAKEQGENLKAEEEAMNDICQIDFEL
jgi:hypothetical protein